MLRCRGWLLVGHGILSIQGVYYHYFAVKVARTVISRAIVSTKKGSQLNLTPLDILGDVALRTANEPRQQ